MYIGSIDTVENNIYNEFEVQEGRNHEHAGNLKIDSWIESGWMG